MSLEMIELQTSPVFLANLQAYENPKYKIIVNQGGTRSGKSYSIMQLLIKIGYYENKEISVVSKTLPHIKRGSLRDFKKIVYDIGIYDDKKFNKSELIYKFNPNSFIEFFSADDGSKLRGPGRDDLFINEANLLSKDEWKQLIFRTRGKAIIDYNPVDEFHWIYDDILTRPDCKFIQSCYLDNYDYLPPEQIREIEMLRDEDNNYWKIFGLGERATSTNLIYPNFRIQDFVHEGETIYGLDFGYQHPTALTKVSLSNNTLYLEQKLYEGTINSELIKQLEFLISNRFDYIYADSSDPARIEEIKNAGFNIHPADKGPNSVKSGIDYIKRFNIVIHTESVDLQKEMKSYKWKEDKSGNILDEPLKFHDDLMDSFRYAVFSHRNYLGNIPSFPNIHINPNNRQFDKYHQY